MLNNTLPSGCQESQNRLYSGVRTGYVEEAVSSPGYSEDQRIQETDLTARGKNNALTDVAGIAVGHKTDLEAVSGTTVILCEKRAVAGVDVRGSAPGTRETDLLDPINLVEQVQAVVLSGGSVYGLAAAQGVTDWLAGKGIGFPLEGDEVAPIVPAAVLFDLGRGPEFRPPVEPDWGRSACEAATMGEFALGNAGCGSGALTGGIKGGLGTASEVLEMGITVGAIVGLNSLGSVIDPRIGRPWEIGLEVEGEFGTLGRKAVRLPLPPDPQAGQNTTIAVVATDAIMTKAQAKKVAQMAQDGLARAIRPAHTMFDGDTVFCLATGKKEMPDAEGLFIAPKAPALSEIGRAAADCLSRAIIRALIEAESVGDLRAFRDLEEK
jgi:L-aminopeptidase/D-esterase-like protein